MNALLEANAYLRNPHPPPAIGPALSEIYIYRIAGRSNVVQCAIDEANYFRR